MNREEVVPFFDVCFSRLSGRGNRKGLLLENLVLYGCFIFLLIVKNSSGQRFYVTANLV